jgi:alcohol dehydrogenase class IV
MSLASLFSGLALANGGLGAVHGIAGPLGGWIEIPHGIACGRLLPPVFAANVRRLQSTNHPTETLHRFGELARILTRNPHAAISDGKAWIDGLCRQLDVSPLEQFGLRESDLPVIAAKAINASSMRGNPVGLHEEDLVGILKQALK